MSIYKFSISTSITLLLRKVERSRLLKINQLLGSPLLEMELPVREAELTHL
jgi:hypothetical protein